MSNFKFQEVLPRGGGGGSVELDATLTSETKAAQAKAVGDKIKDLELRVVAVEITDTTLTQESKAADAKAVGDKLKNEYATKTYVDSAVANAGGGGGGSGASAIACSEGLAYTLKDNGEYEVTGIGTCTDKHIVIPAMIGSVRVTSIGEKAFEYARTCESITMPDSITSIGKDAFGFASNLKSITIPNGVTSIGNQAFQSCSKLERVTIADGATHIGQSAFCYCEKLVSVTIPKSVTTIEKNAFIYSNSALKIYCEAESQPSGWDANWNYTYTSQDTFFPVLWGAALDFASVNKKIELDTTLTKEGNPADAKAVGTKLNSYASKEWVTNAISNAGTIGAGGGAEVLVYNNGLVLSMEQAAEFSFGIKVKTETQVVQ